MNRLRLAATHALVCLGVATFAAAPAKAIVIAEPTTTYDFSANCEDCAELAHTATYTVYGQLVLDSTYVLGDPIAPYFVSFTYDGSNLFGKFTVTASEVESLIGALPTVLPGPPAVSIDLSTIVPFGPHPYDDRIGVGADGFWFIGQEPADFGQDASFSVPEPSTWAMMLLGFAALAYAGVGARARAARA
jgi:hypothetical protein